MTFDEDAASSPGPRRISRVRLVLTILGEYGWHLWVPLPPGALVTALTDLGLKEAPARATLARMARSDLLLAERVGRRTTHRLSPHAQDMVDEEGTWLESFGRGEPRWDGLWSVLAFSIPESERSSRHLARSRLRWLGFAPLYDGVWLSPRDSAAEAMAQLRQLGVRDVTAMRATLETSIAGGPQSAWALEDVAGEYRRFAADIEAAGIPAEPVAAFRERMRVMLGWQAFRMRDTGIPAELLPADWPRMSTRRAWARRYNELGDCAEARMRLLVSEIDADLAALVSRRRMPEDLNT
jgi:phenylacetic acid degradation operon negative regulatory protein